MGNLWMRWAGLLGGGAGMATLVLAVGVGLAHAEPGADSGTGSPSTSSESDSGSSESDAADDGGADPGGEAPDPKGTPEEEAPSTAEPDPEDSVVEPEESETPETDPLGTVSDRPASSATKRSPDKPAETVAEDAEPQERVTAEQEPVAAQRSVTRRPAARAAVRVAGVVAATAVTESVAKPEPTAVATAAATGRPNLVNIVGTLFFRLFDNVVKLFEGPPAVPPGRAVQIARTPLELDCGNGYTVDADWYFPTETTPDKIIYFQHGAFARAGLYGVTAADLAVRNNAIVVAPSITTNFFACDGCTVAGDQMHAAVADLFIGDRAALTASALAAGWSAPLPQRFVLAGHSAGGLLAAGAGGYYAVRAPADQVSDLAGVLLLDTTTAGGAVERAIGRIPDDIPVHHIAASPALLNDFGAVNSLLADQRSGFVGVQLIGGAHADAWRPANEFFEFVVGVATGFSKQRNVDAVQVLAQAWIADWYAGTHTDEFYGERGETIDIATPTGQAQAYVLPGPSPRLTFIDHLMRAALRTTELLSAFSGNYAADPATEPAQIRNSTADTALSLDGRRQTGQSVGQHVCTG
ncbi:hypothetical protein [Mycolicibacterium bacteremicum]|uniref:hypothetical protein n=1 Tax=Mycolicibacterium bacteremicum TaxID=564198 RepID=UPI0026EC9731|nr:hypothetical protein [Mycolicibacterium bacteremicum]